MRLGLLSLISWMVTLTKPLFTVMDFSFSGRDLIMLFGGYSCCLKQQPNCMNGWKTAIMIPATVKADASFWVVVTQIVILDAVFSRWMR